MLKSDNIGLADFRYVHNTTLKLLASVCGFMYDINAQKWGKIFLTLFFLHSKLEDSHTIKLIRLKFIISWVLLVYSEDYIVVATILIPKHFHPLPKTHICLIVTPYLNLSSSPLAKLTYNFYFNRFVCSGHLI